MPRIKKEFIKVALFPSGVFPSNGEVLDYCLSPEALGSPRKPKEMAADELINVWKLAHVPSVARSTLVKKIDVLVKVVVTSGSLT